MVVRNRIGWLGQAKGPVTLRLVVKDVKDRGFTGIPFIVTRTGAGELPISGVTNGNGTSVVSFETAGDAFIVQAKLPEGMVAHPMQTKDAASQVMTIRSVEEAPQAFLTTMEIVAGGSGIALILIGLFSKFPLVGRVGEAVVMATAFYRVGRAVM